jgi:ComF family protein
MSHSRCKTKNNPIEATFVFYSYSGPINKILKAVKYRLQPQLLKDFLFFLQMQKLILLKDWLRLFRLETVTSVPLHPHSLYQRGFNQSEIIACFIAQYFGLRYLNIINKIKKTNKQTQIKKHARLGNIKSAFKVSQPTNTERVLLVDDVITTGATIKEASSALISGGVKKVFALSLFGAF